MPTEYKTLEYKLHEYLVQIQDMLSLLEFDEDLQKEIADCKELIKTKKFNIAVMGEFRRGKSSLINALLGSRILPADATPTTATLNRITYGTTPRTILSFKDGTTQEIGFEELPDYVTKITAAGEARAMLVKEATVYFPTVICQNHIDIIDTPGLNDDARMTQITIDMLQNVDAVIVPIHARAPFSDTEKNFVCQLLKSGNIRNIVFVITFMDQLDEDDYEYDRFTGAIKTTILERVFKELENQKAEEAVIRKAHDILDQTQIIGISAKLALNAFVSNNQAMLQQSRFEEFSNYLLRVATSAQMENALVHSAGKIREVASQFDEQNRRKTEQFQREKASLEEAHEKVGSYCLTCKKKMDELFARDYDEVTAAIARINPLKNQIMSEFIRALSSLKTTSHTAIKDTLTATQERLLESLNVRITSEIASLLNQVVELEWQEIVSFRKKTLLPYLEPLELTALVAEKNATDSMHRTALTALKSLSFRWALPAVPPAPDLSQCDVIQTVAQATNLSIDKCLTDFNSCFNEIRKNWFGSLGAEVEEIAKKAEEQYQEKHKKLEEKTTTYGKNYHVFFKKSQTILSECEHLFTEFRVRSE